MPTLRNIELTSPYFHDGSVWTLEEAVKTMGELQLGLALNDADAGAIAQFLRTLTGKQPDIKIPMLPPSSATTPKPAFN